jgi:hypothetical protein
MPSFKYLTRGKRDGIPSLFLMDYYDIMKLQIKPLPSTVRLFFRKICKVTNDWPTVQVFEYFGHLEPRIWYILSQHSICREPGSK